MSRGRMCLAGKHLKLCFPDEAAAQLALEDAQAPGRRRRRGKAGVREQRAYLCEACGLWHLTSLGEAPDRSAR